jgi:hypothetical protein
VLSRLVESPRALQAVARKALEICHWTGDDEMPAAEAELINTEEECEAGCYRCLLSYNNQREHELIDRRLPELKQFLLDLLRGEVVGQGGTDSRGERLERLLGLAGSGLERLWLETLHRHSYHLPDKAQSAVPGHYVVPDFTYTSSCALVFIDGPHHEQQLQVQLDQEKRQALVDAGMTVVVFDQYTESWDAVIAEYRWLFGEGEGMAQGCSLAGGKP